MSIQVGNGENYLKKMYEAASKLKLGAGGGASVGAGIGGAAAKAGQKAPEQLMPFGKLTGMTTPQMGDFHVNKPIATADATKVYKDHKVLGLEGTNFASWA